MEFKSIEYQIVQTANPTGWKSTVLIEGKRKNTGSTFRRLSATRLAETAIEKHLKTDARKPPESICSPSVG